MGGAPPHYIHPCFLHVFSSSTFLGCVSEPWIAPGTLVVISNDEWDHLQPISMQSSPFNAPFCIVQ